MNSIFFGIIQQNQIPNGVRAWYGDRVNTGVLRQSLSNGTAITRWDDLSGNGFHLDTKTGTVNYETSTNSINLSGGALYNSSHAVVTGSTQRTIFSVSQATNVATTQEPLFLGNAGSTATAWFPQPAAATIRVDTNASFNQFNAVNTNNVDSLITSILTGGTTVASIKARKNGVNLSVNSTNVNGGTINTAAGIMVGGYLISGTPTVRGNTKIKEVIIYNRLLTDSEILQVEAYLLNKYILPTTYTFAANGDITIPAGFSSMQYLIVGGGAGGGGSTTSNSASGGGGGGEALEGVISNPASGTYTFTVGAGATALGNTSTSRGSNGSNSVLTKPDASTITALGGKGGAGSAQGATNATSTEGAGGGSSILAYIAKGTGTNEGGAGTSTTAAGGGGGAGGDGSTATSTTATPNNGGAGFTSTYFGGTYGAGGGSFAVHATGRVGVSGSANTGNGGSGKNRVGSNNANSAGGSGIVIIKLIK